MEMLEVITLRSLHGIPKELAQELARAPGSDSGVRLALYRHATVGTDLSVHLIREVEGGEVGTSDLGLRLAAALRQHGQVSHSVWEKVTLEGHVEPGRDSS